MGELALREEVRDVVRAAEFQRDDVVNLKRLAVLLGRAHPILGLDVALLGVGHVAVVVGRELALTGADHALRELLRVRAWRAVAVGVRPACAPGRLCAGREEDGRTRVLLGSAKSGCESDTPARYDDGE